MSAASTGKRPRHRPQRTCVACRQTEDQRGLVRLVRGPEGRVTVDERGRAPGRGAYLHPSKRCWERALAGVGGKGGGALAHALRATIDEDDRAALTAYAARFADEGPQADDGAAQTATRAASEPREPRAASRQARGTESETR